MTTTNENTHADLLREMRENHAALMQAQQAQIDSNTRRAEECMRLRQAEEMRISEERLRRETYAALIERLDLFLSRADLTLEVLRLIAAGQKTDADKLLKGLSDNERLKLEKLHGLEKAAILETDAARKLKLRAEIEELKGL